MENKKLSLPTKVGYGMCIAADSIPFNLFTLFFVWFLTVAVGVPPQIAGLIAFVAVLWDGITDPIIGGFSDKYVSEKGRRLPLMKASILPLSFMVYFLYAPFEFQNPAIVILYYVVVTMMIRFTYTFFLVPYYALAPEITADYGERNQLRFAALYIAYPLLMLVSSGTMWILAWTEAEGFTARQSWGYVGLVFSILLFIMCCIGMFIIRNCEKDSLKRAIEAQKTKVQESFIKVWGKCLRVRSYLMVFAWVIIFMIGFSMLNTVFIYIMSWNAQMTFAQQGTFWIIYTLMVVATLPFTTYFCNKYGKRPTLLVAMAPTIVLSVVFFFIGINSMAAMYVFSFFSVIGSSAFFTFYLSFAYDCVEIDEYLTGERREGAMAALTTFANKAGAAVGLYVSGHILGMTGFDGLAAEQTDQALQGMLALGTIIPAVLFIIAYIILIRYPVSKKRFETLCVAIEKRKAGEEYSEDEFKAVL